MRSSVETEGPWTERSAGRSPRGTACTARTRSCGDQCDDRDAPEVGFLVVLRAAAVARLQRRHALRGDQHVRELQRRLPLRFVVVLLGVNLDRLDSHAERGRERPEVFHRRLGDVLVAQFLEARVEELVVRRLEPLPRGVGRVRGVLRLVVEERGRVVRLVADALHELGLARATDGASADA